MNVSAGVRINGDKDGVRELLLTAPAEVPYPEKWWPMRERQVREALSEGDSALAVRLLGRNGQKEGTLPHKEAEWLKGWIELEYQNQTGNAYTVFSNLLRARIPPPARHVPPTGPGAQRKKPVARTRCTGTRGPLPIPRRFMASLLHGRWTRTTASAFLPAPSRRQPQKSVSRSVNWCRCVCAGQRA